MNTTDPLHILLLEDHGIVRAGLKALLKETLSTAYIHEASGYEQAIAVLTGTAIDFAFLDYKLSGVSGKTGLDVLHFIRQQELPTRAVILSGGFTSNGHLAKELVLQCLEAGASGYIPKALEGDCVLQEAFQTVLQGRIFLPSCLLEHHADGPPLPQTLEALGVTGRLREVLYYVCQGYVSKTIASRMQLSDGSVRNYVSRVLKQFKVKTRSQLLIEVARLGVVIPKPAAMVACGQAD